MNPFELARAELRSPHAPEQALAALAELVELGFEAGDRHYRLFGARHGRFVTMSLGLPILGGGAPVLRARLRESPGPTAFDVSVGARLEIVLLGSFWLLVTVLGGSYQLFLQLRAVATSRGSWSDVTDVLPGIGIMVGILALGTWLFRRRAARDTELLLRVFRDTVDPDRADTTGIVAPPIH